MNKHENDTYRTVKCSLKKCLKNKNYNSILFDAVQRTNKIITRVCLLLRLWILDKYHKNEKIPYISEETIRMAIKALSQDGKGPKPKGNNLLLFNEFVLFYENVFNELIKNDMNNENDEKINASRLAQTLHFSAISLFTNIETNIKFNFFKYVKRYVNSSFININNKIIEESSNKKEITKQLNKELYFVKQDLINNTLLSDTKYHAWLENKRYNIFPKNLNVSYYDDIKDNPQNYFKSMIFMCLELEKNKTKSFQFFPLRTGIIPKYIPLDTKSLIELFIEKDKNTFNNDVEGTKEKIWRSIFNIDNKVFKQKEYSFDHKISTDGFAISIQLIKNSKIEIKKERNIKKKEAIKQSKEIYKGMTAEETKQYRNKIKNDKKEETKEKRKEMRKKNSEKEKKEKEEYKKLDEIQKKEQMKNDKIKKRGEFPYLEELNEKELEMLKDTNKIYIDGGKRCLLYMKDDKGNRIRFTNKRYMKEIKRLKYQRIIKNHKNKILYDIDKDLTLSMSEIESVLSNYNSKSCELKTFERYITTKNKINDKLTKEYENEIYRKYKWYAYMNKQRSEEKIIKEMKDVFGEKSIMIYGDWSAKDQLKNYISTPNLGLKRRIGKEFKIYSIDEFRTSKLNNKTEKESDNLYLPDKEGKSRKKHAILTYQMENKRIGCINRDENSVENMAKITNYFLKYNERPQNYRRGIIICNNKGFQPLTRKGKSSNEIKPEKVQMGIYCTC